MLLKRIMMTPSRIIILTLAILMAACSTNQSENKPSPQSESSKKSTMTERTDQTKESKDLYPALQTYIEKRIADFDQIDEKRKAKLSQVANYIAQKKQEGEKAKLTFICTHNSRRSHLSQIWAATAAAHYGLSDFVDTYSGGTEATAFNPRAVAAIERAGFKVVGSVGNNPTYKVNFAEGANPMRCYSKKYDDPANPRENFMAVMTCSEADQNCPFIPGAESRIALPYNDPKEADGTELEAQTYDERCRQIATEILYILSRV
jgi:arsenate reductase